MTPWAYQQKIENVSHRSQHTFFSSVAWLMTQNNQGSTATPSIPTSIDSMPPLFSSTAKYINDITKPMEVIIEAAENGQLGKNTQGEDDAFLEAIPADGATASSSMLCSDDDDSSSAASILSGNMEIPTSELDILEDLIEVRDWDALLHFAGDVLENQKDQDDSVSSQPSSHSEISSPNEPSPSHPKAYHDDKDDDYETFPFGKSSRSDNQCCQWPLLYRLFEGVSNKNILILHPSDDQSSDAKRISVK